MVIYKDVGSAKNQKNIDIILFVLLVCTSFEKDNLKTINEEVITSEENT